MAQSPLPKNRRTIRTGPIDGAKRRWIVAGGGLVGFVLIAAITPWLFSLARPTASIATTPTAIARSHTPIPATKIAGWRTPTLPISAPVATSAMAYTLVEAQVVRILDGDTLEVAGQQLEIQLIGVNAPEISTPICFGPEAVEYAQQMIDKAGGHVWLEIDVSNVGNMGRLLRYVWLDIKGDRQMLNEAMLEGGFAKVAENGLVKHKDRLLTVEHDAKIAKRGLWGACDEFGEFLPAQVSTTSPTPQIITPTLPPTNAPTVEASPTLRPTSTPLPSLPSAPSPTATRTSGAPSPTKPAPPTVVPTRTSTRTVKPTLPTASPIIAVLPTIAPTQPASSATALPQQTPEPQPQPTATSISTVPIELPQPTATADTASLRYDPNGPDRDCPDFDTWEEAQAFFIAAGGPERDPHRLDGDNDGIACENLRK